MKSFAQSFAVLTMLIVSWTASAAESYEGRWEGSVFVSTSELPVPVQASSRVIVTRKVKVMNEEDVASKGAEPVKAEVLNIWECFWAFPGGRLPVGTCNESDFQITNDTDLNVEGRKVGDMNPRRVMVLNSNAQNAEQMVLQLADENTMSFTYSYANNDGDSIYRRAILKKTGN